MKNTRQDSQATARIRKNTCIRNQLGVAVLLTCVGLLASRINPAWSDPTQTASSAAPQLEQMQQTLERNRSELDKVRDKLEWAQELLQHAGETLYLARTQHQQTLAVQRMLEQKIAAAHTKSLHEQAARKREAALADSGNSRQLDHYRMQIQELQQERDQLRQTLKSRDQHLVQLQDELQAMRSSRQLAEQDATTTRNELYNVRSQYRICQNQWGEFSNKLDNLNISVTAAQQSLATTMHTRNLLQDRLSACNENLSHVRASFASMESASMPRPASGEPPAQRDSETSPAGEGLPADSIHRQENGDLQSGTGTIPCSIASAADNYSNDCLPESGISLQGVRFRYDSAELEDESRAILNRAAAALIRRPDISHEVAGHTDNQGNAAYNLWLSLQRANTVRDYLIARGVDGKRLLARGYGGRRPVADNSTWDGLVSNRRVELHALRHSESSAVDTAGIHQEKL